MENINDGNLLKVQPAVEVDVEEKLNNFETKVDEVLNILNMILNENKTEKEEGIKQADKYLFIKIVS